MDLILTIMIAAFIQWTSSDSCPEQYLKFSANHTACLPLNTKCHFLQMGVSYEDAGEILDIHNFLRSKVATGQESRAGGMPQASNMMQMEWDNELARLAQNEAEKCEPISNCPACRTVENFKVGQVVEYRHTNCLENSCSRQKPAWKDIIQSIYNGIDKYDSKDVGSYRRQAASTQFSQLIWADTWRVGCGYASYLQDSVARHVFICNYGPGGNLWAEPVYQQGPSCTACPSNACCGSKCTSIAESLEGFEGLCKMISPNVAPVYQEQQESLFYCNFDDEENPDDDCYSDESGVYKWTTKQTLMGNIKSIKLSGGETSRLHFMEPIEPESDICVHLQFRQGSATGGIENSARVILTVIHHGNILHKYSLRNTGNHFVTQKVHVPVHVPAGDYVYLTIEYSVGESSPDSILDIRSIAVFEGLCSPEDATDDDEEEADKRK